MLRTGCFDEKQKQQHVQIQACVRTGWDRSAVADKRCTGGAPSAAALTALTAGKVGRLPVRRLFGVLKGPLLKGPKKWAPAFGVCRLGPGAAPGSVVGRSTYFGRLWLRSETATLAGSIGSAHLGTAAAARLARSFRPPATRHDYFSHSTNNLTTSMQHTIPAV